MASTVEFPENGNLTVENETIAYTGKTSTTFTGLTRGSSSTTAAADKRIEVVGFSRFDSPTINAIIASPAQMKDSRRTTQDQRIWDGNIATSRPAPNA